MEAGFEPVGSHEVVLRRIRFEHYDRNKSQFPAAEAFRPNQHDADGLSLRRRLYVTVEDASIGLPGKHYYVGLLRSSDIRNLGATLRPDDPQAPDSERGHCVIPELNYSNRRTAASESLQRQLAERVLKVKGPYVSEAQSTLGMGIVFEKAFAAKVAKFGIRRQHAEEAVRQSDQRQIIRHGDLEMRLYSKWIGKASPPFLLVVMILVKENQEVIVGAYKAYPSLGGDIRGDPPLNVLRALAQRFGRVVTIGQRSEKFILQEDIPVEEPNVRSCMSVAVGASKEVNIEMCVKIEIGPTPKLRAALVFAMDVEEYSTWIRKGG